MMRNENEYEIMEILVVLRSGSHPEQNGLPSKSLMTRVRHLSVLSIRVFSGSLILMGILIQMTRQILSTIPGD